MKKLSFVIPCYCSEKSIKKVVDDIIKNSKRMMVDTLMR